MSLLPELITFIVDEYLPSKEAIDAIRQVEEYKYVPKNYSNIIISLDNYNNIQEMSEFYFRKIECFRMASPNKIITTNHQKNRKSRWGQTCYKYR